MLTKRKDGRYVKKKIIAGRTVYFYSSEPTEKKALKDIESQMLNYTEREERGKLLSEVTDEWESQHYTHIRIQTEERYRSYVKRLLSFYGNLYIKEIKADDINRLLNDMSAELFSTKTIRDQFSVIKLIFTYAYIKSYVKTNITDYIHPPKGKPKVVREALSEIDVEKIKSDKSSEFGKIAYFLLCTGLRKGELLALKYSDIDFDNNIIKITKEIEYVGNVPRIGKPKSDAGIRNVPLPDTLKSLLDSDKHSEDDIIFGYRNDYMHKSYFRDGWRKYREKIGVYFTPHQLRHTYITQLYEWGIEDKDTQVIVGHSDISITKNIYTHLRENKLKTATEIINKNI